METTNVCLQCSKVFKGRSDKRFCGDKCRGQFNYRNRNKKAGYKNLMKRTNDILKKNRQILERIYAEAGAITTMDLLTSKGFDFNYYTHMKDIAGQEHYFYCYDMGYSLYREQVRIVQ